jgi:hypothetical protein
VRGQLPHFNVTDDGRDRLEGSVQDPV